MVSSDNLKNPFYLLFLMVLQAETQTDLSDGETQTELELVGKQIREISKTKSELEEVEKKIQEIVKIKTTLERERDNESHLGLCGDPWVRATDLPPPSDFPVQVDLLTIHVTKQIEITIYSSTPGAVGVLAISMQK